MFAICENTFNRTAFSEKEEAIKAPLGIAISIIFALGGVFLILAYYQILPYGANCISNLGTGGLVFGSGLTGLGIAFLIYNLMKSCLQLTHTTDDIYSSSGPSITSNATPRKSNNREDTRSWNLKSFAFNKDLQGSTSNLAPDRHSFSDLLSRCQNPNVCFLSGSMAVGHRSSLPLEEIKEAFAQGKKMVLIRQSTAKHCFVLGCCADGSFKIIDSMFDNSIDCQKVANALNQANINNPQGERIHFSGEYINTHIQQGGNDCIRFATLYCYHMAEQQDLEAYQEVNGAFLDKGRLLHFEDYKKISGAPKIRSLSGKSYTYESFMISWRYRMLGWTVNTWEEFSLQEIFAKLNISNINTCVALMSKDKKMPYFFDTEVNKLFIQISFFQKQAIHSENLQDLLEQVNVDMSVPISQSLCLEKNEFLLLWKHDSHSFEVFRLRTDQKFVVDEK